jgi:hypothetical protein
VFDSTAPGPLFRAFDESRADGVVEHVRDRVVVVLLVVDHPGGEARTEERSLAPKAGVVLAGVMALEPLDGRRESLDRPVDDGVVVGRHQAVRVEAEGPAPDALLQESQEGTEVLRVAEERRRINRVGGEVEEAVGEPATKDPRHAIQGMQPAGRRSPTTPLLIQS